jgi:vacuolar iron transporter family protein
MDKAEELKKHLEAEKERVGKLSKIREIVFGAQDGLLVPLGVVSSVAGAFSNNHIVIVAGISEALAGAFSMATGAYLSTQAEQQVHNAEILKERSEIKKNPKGKREEAILLHESMGLSRKDATVVVDGLLNSSKAFFSALVYNKFGIDPEPERTPTGDAISIGLSYLFTAMIPLLPYFFLNTARALPVSIGLTLLTLFSLGILKAKLAFLPMLKSGLQVMLIEGFSGLGGYLLGTLLPKILGIGQ